MSMKAQQNSANAIRSQNLATEQAQNEGFMQRTAAANAQTSAQTAAMNQTMADRNAAATQMRQAQTAAMTQQSDILSAENTQADALRQAGDTAANTMLTQTTAPNLAAAQTGSQAQAAALLSSPGTSPILGPTATDPSGGTSGDAGTDATNQALARRTAEAATNIRDYGVKVGAVTSYAQPGQTVSDAITANRFGIMPAQTAANLLQAGSAVRLLPSQIAYQNATATGAATDALISSRGQSALDAAGLSYGNATDIANLGQQDTSTLATNTAAQAKADAAAQASLGGLVTGVGNLGMYGAGYYGGGPAWLKNLLPGSQVPAAGTGGAGIPLSGGVPLGAYPNAGIV